LLCVRCAPRANGPRRRLPVHLPFPPRCSFSRRS
jgi:hypothetical protein